MSEAERIATGFVFTEGPLWHPVERELTFSDVFGNVMYRWSEAVRPASSGGRARERREYLGPARVPDYVRAPRSAGEPDKSERQPRCGGAGVRGQAVEQPERRHLRRGRGDIIFTDPPYGLLRPDIASEHKTSRSRAYIASLRVTARSSCSLTTSTGRTGS